MLNAIDLSMNIFELSLDSFLAGLAAYPVLRSVSRGAVLAVACGICDGVASFIGRFVWHVSADLPDWIIYTACVLLILQSVRTNRMWLFGVPVLLSVDNLFSAAPAQDVSLPALASTTMAAFGLVLGYFSALAFEKASPLWLLSRRA